MATALIILAAGQGTRMNSDTPKVLHKLGGAPLFAHAMAVGQTLQPDKTVLVVGYGGAEVARAARDIDQEILIVEQDEQLGTGHAVAQTRAVMRDFSGDLVVLYGDTPFVQPETLQKMAQQRADHNLVVLGFETGDPGGYGRLVMDGHRLLRIVEAADCTDEERRITFCNSGILMAPCDVIFDLIDGITKQNNNEVYLTDVVQLANDRGLSATAITCDDAETLGINSRVHLVQAEAVFQTRARNAAIEIGVSLMAPDTVYFSLDTVLGRDVAVEPNVFFGPGVSVESGARIRAFCHLEGCHIGAGATVGPFARLRPGAEISNTARIGNFVEIKNSEIGEGAKVGHLAYIGDTILGDGANIGAGTVTCNFDGVNKHRTVIGKNAFVGSDTMLIAPVRIGDDAMTASGSVITRDVPDGALAVARTPQENKSGLARKLFEKFKSAAKNPAKG